ncbi:AbrB/MazE/SpoVT family DNA-binding domain-containing protein [Candidatus Woesearchaeota archaeon]|nr:AbrB/MazE/SpoVT family DNA-binding domain-containing protein [Candidatus Woesearchaeota archaeon]
MKEMSAKTPDDVRYRFYKCEKCNEEIVDMGQLEEVAREYRKMKRFNTKISRWGTSLGVRIPKELVEKYNLKDKKEVAIVPKEKFIKIIPV